MSRTLAAALLLLPALALGQADVGVVDALSGEAIFIPQSGAAGRVTAFMKVREGDRFELKRGAELRLVYVESARQERWAGPAAFRAGSKQSVPISGAAPAVAMLPPHVALKLGRVPELLRTAEMGGVQIRSSAPGAKAPRETVEEARITYEKLRRDARPDDIAPELYLFSVLNEHKRYDEMAAVAATMRRKQPNSEAVRILGTWSENVKKR